GTGLGLATVYAIVKRYEGGISVESEPGLGTSFRIYMPAAGKKTNDPEEEMKDTSTYPGGTETILLAEDDEQVRNITVDMLDMAGYNLLIACDGTEAIDLFKQHMNEIDLVLLDVIMPKKSGRLVHDFIKTIRPNMPVLFVSGYSFNALETGSLPEKGYELLRKPFLYDELLIRVREMLGKEKAGV
ncbi:MAG: response regulator, partial [bacterium]|nr:response regulator [bacterium]